MNERSLGPISKRPLGRTGLEIAPLVFGGNVFGWTVDQQTAFTLLDRFVEGGLNAIDTADAYSTWVPGNQGGESETIIGNWFKASPARREKIVLITKVGAQLAEDKKGLSAKRIAEAAENSLRRLQTDYIDLYLSHRPDPETPVDETLRAYENLIRQGKVKAIGASNYNAVQLREALTIASKQGLPRYEVLEPEYNLYDRSGYEGELRDLCIEEGLGVITYYSLASGFLSGKYRSHDDLGKSVRGRVASKYLNDRGFRILSALDTVAGAHGAAPAEAALAWLIARECVTAPIASATNVQQVDSLIRAAHLTLSPSDIDLLSVASG
ncbi:aldo/keto reductase [Nitrosovibrio sp. Nv6]|uniref:aldo/keto reductase n=1 Tax=Nitrosovibrio sp. Nv6 TaxID=1855340 RepID=UPI0008C896FD|nr:aldo/keto reductase [Nitrosovibrio sp. Nv6]SEO44594.1 Predicted oxidoreductase [Nitrosovibrio sp. Nv6]